MADEALIPNDKGLFRGFSTSCATISPFHGAISVSISPGLPKFPAARSQDSDIVIAFDEVKPQLAAAVRKEFFALYAAPGVNLFDKTLDRIPVRSDQFEFPVIPDRSRLLDFETTG